jgi:hypothetical protein
VAAVEDDLPELIFAEGFEMEIAQMGAQISENGLPE